MRNKITALMCLLLAMAALPAMVVQFSGHGIDLSANAATKDSAKKTSYTEKGGIICKAAAKLCGEDFCDEAVKAVLILINTDYILNDDFSEIEENTASEELLPKIKKAYNSVSELYLSKDGEALYIPYSNISNGKTIVSETYPYLCSVASPWDCLDESFSENIECTGVSLRGINYLCEKGYSAEDALLWYLPNFIIEKS